MKEQVKEDSIFALMIGSYIFALAAYAAPLLDAFGDDVVKVSFTQSARCQSADMLKKEPKEVRTLIGSFDSWKGKTVRATCDSYSNSEGYTGIDPFNDTPAGADFTTVFYETNSAKLPEGIALKAGNFQGGSLRELMNQAGEPTAIQTRSIKEDHIMLIYDTGSCVLNTKTMQVSDCGLG